MTDHCFISYSGADGLDFATRLADELQGQHPFFKVWFDKRELSSSSSDDWDDQLGNAIKACKCLIFVMTEDSTADGSVCKDEWTWALKYKKPVITIRKDQKADVPFRLNNRQHVDFVTSFDVGIAQLRTALARLDLPEGALDELKSRLADANRDLRRAKPEYQLRIKVDIEELKKQIEVQENIVKDPQAAQEQTQKNIETGLERERHPEKPLAPKTSGKFINQPPGIAQTYFRDRELESEQTILFLKNDAQRIMTIAGRGGAGKTAMTCRLLKHIENGTLPDGFEKKHGKIEVDGIIYLSETGSRKINFANLFADLCLLLSNDTATKLTALYKQPQTSTESKTLQLLEAFQGLKQLIVLLDNFENVVDVVSETIKDLELGEALRTILHAPHHPLKIIITTRATAERFNLYEPARQRVLHLDTGLLPEYAKEAFVLMDEDDLVGIKNSGNELLDLAVTRTLGLPRALEALYAALRSDRFTTLKELLDLPVLPENVVEAYVGEAFNRLDTNAQKVMQALAVYNRPVTPAAVDYLLAPHIPAMDSAPILQRLANMHFARKESGRFYLHPVDREFAFGLIPEKDLTTKDTMVTKEKEKVSDVPDVSDVIKVKPDDVIPASETDEESTRKAKQAVEELKALFAEMKAKESNYQLPFTQHALTRRAADYFKKARKPRSEWKKLDDLTAQLAEFDLRCVAGDYDTAGVVLTEIDFDYLLLWGHYRLMIDLCKQIVIFIKNKMLLIRILNVLETAYRETGDNRNSVNYIEQGLGIAKEIKNRQAESALLGDLGLAYVHLGHTDKAIEFHEKALMISREIADREGEGRDLSNLGNIYADLGDNSKAIEYYEQALVIAREVGNRQDEGSDLNNLGNAYGELGDDHKAIEYYEQALIIAREIGYRRNEGNHLINIGSKHANLGNFNQAIELYEQALTITREIGNKSSESGALCNIGFGLLDLDNYKDAIDFFEDAIQVADEISHSSVQQIARHGLTNAYLFQNDLVDARATIDAALRYDLPKNNHNATALHGIIALRQGDVSAAHQSFTRAIAQADEILAKTPDYYSALDAKGLALCGLAVCRGGSRSARTQSVGSARPEFDQDIDSFRAARKIAPHAGAKRSSPCCGCSMNWSSAMKIMY